MTRRRRTTLRVLPFVRRLPPAPAQRSDADVLHEQIDRLAVIHPHGCTVLRLVAHKLLRKYDPEYQPGNTPTVWG